MPLSQQVHKGIIWVIAFAGLIGFADSVFLSVKHFQKVVPPCVLFSGCDVVTTSSYAVIAGVPVAVLGAVYYFVILVLTLLYLDRRNAKIIKILAAVSTCGFLFTLWLLYLQIFVIHALCTYCLLSSVMSTIIFVISVITLSKKSYSSAPTQGV